MYKSLNDFIKTLDREGELARIAVKVDPVEEICELTDRESKKPGGGRALLFEDTGTAFPVVTNIMGSEKRIAMALGSQNLDSLTARIEELFKKALAPKSTAKDKLAMLPLLNEVSNWLPRTVKGRGECQQVILQGGGVDLGILPVLKCWPHDGGRFVTLPLVHTIDPDSGIRNVGMYRMQVFDKTSTGMHWHLHKTGERHYRRYKELGRIMPVSVALGGDPAYTYAATAPMPDNMDEYLLAGFIRRRPVELVKCITNDLTVPADCDIVIEGYVDPAEDKVIEGPFGDHTGFYSLEDFYPVFHVTAITHRKNAVYPATIVGIPPQEDAYIGMATEKIFLAPIRLALQPEVADLHMPPQGVAHNIAIVDIKKSYPGQGLKTASALWGAGQMMFNKYLIVTASGGDIRNPETIRRLIHGLDIPNDIMTGKGPLDILDHAAAVMGVGGKMAFDLTGTTPQDPEPPLLPSTWDMCCGVEEVDKLLAESWLTLVLKCSKDASPSEFLERNEIKGIKLVLLIDSNMDASDANDLLWLVSGNSDPSRDMAVHQGMLIIDGRIKAGTEGFARPWPNVVTSSEQTIKLVDSRASEYGIGEMPSSPSLKYKKLVKGDGACFDE